MKYQPTAAKIAHAVQAGTPMTVTEDDSPAAAQLTEPLPERFSHA